MFVSCSTQRDLDGNNQEKFMKEETGTIVVIFFS